MDPQRQSMTSKDATCRPAICGFTLVEFVVVIVLMGIVFVFAGRFFSTAFSAFFGGRDIATADSQARVAFERVVRELRAVRSTADVDIASATQIRFVDLDGNGICFYRDAVGNRLMRSANGPTSACGTTSPQPLADSVTALTFSYWLNDGRTTTAVAASTYYIGIAVTVNNNTGYNGQFRTNVHPRNF